MTINIQALEELELAVLSAVEQNLANIKRELQDRLAGGLPVDREDPIRHYEFYLDALCDVRLGAWRWNSLVAGDSRLVALTAAEITMGTVPHHAGIDEAEGLEGSELEPELGQVLGEPVGVVRGLLGLE